MTAIREGVGVGELDEDLSEESGEAGLRGDKETALFEGQVVDCCFDAGCSRGEMRC